MTELVEQIAVKRSQKKGAEFAALLLGMGQQVASKNFVGDEPLRDVVGIIEAVAARLDAAKAGTQVYAQLVSSAYGMMHTSAGISGSASMSVGYSYGGDVSGAVAPLSSV